MVLEWQEEERVHTKHLQEDMLEQHLRSEEAGVTCRVRIQENGPDHDQQQVEQVWECGGDQLVSCD